jgi:CHAT domain-containing protein/Tfp pilus assembly protein PilF
MRYYLPVFCRSWGYMRATVRVPLVLIALLTAASVRAQTPIARNLPAQDLLARTKAGQEDQVACNELDAGVAEALVDFGQQSRTESLERLTVAYRLAERAARCAGSDRLVGAALNGLSDTLLGRGQFDAALATANESIRIHERLKDSAGLAEGWNRVGNAHSWLNDTPAALDDFQRALDLSVAAGDRIGQARAWNNIGNVHKWVGELDAALDYYTRARHTFEEIGDGPRTAVVTNNIGLVYFNRGEYESALEYNQRALELNRASGSQIRVAASLDSLGNIHRALGAYRQALQSFQEALTIRTTKDDRLGAMETTHNIGLVHSSQGDDQLAIDAYKRGLHLNRVWGLHAESFVAEALRNIGASAWRLGQRERAVANFRASLVIAQREHLRLIEGELVHDLGETALVDGKVTSASRLFDRALEIRRGIGDQAGITETLSSLASARLANGQPKAALDLAQRALENATAHDQPELRWDAQTLVGIAQRRLHRPEEARRALTDAVRSIEQLSSQVTGGENLRQRFFETKLSPYHELIALLVDQRAFGEALELAERSKARVLTQLLHRSPIDENATLSADEKRDRMRLRDRLFVLNRDIESERAKEPAGANRITALESTRRATREELAAFDASLAAGHPELAAVRGDVSPLRVADATRVLTDPATAIVEYVVADRQLFAFVVTTDGVRIAIDGSAIAIGSTALAARAERFRDRVSSRDFGVLDDARELYDLLVAPIRHRLAGKSRIVIVPDGVLWNVSFQALHGPDGFLIEAAAVSYAPSITVLREIQRLPRSSGPRTLFALGKSNFGPQTTSTLEPLPDAETQVRRIREIYGPDRSVGFIGSEATESRFKAEAPSYDILHLATHGVLDETSPLYSHLVMSSDPHSPRDDGLLEAWEIMRMKLAAEVVVLAACDTGRGRIAPGEGVIGMMWALFAAGARSMVVSQFRIESKSATAMLVAFHRRLAADRGSKSAQLRAAAIELLRTPRFAHPYYWAGFILVGDSD